MVRFIIFSFIVAAAIGVCADYLKADSLAAFEQLNRDQKICAITILAEARSEGDVGMRAVACVIQQRAIEREMSVADVCLQRKQFSCWNDTTLDALEKRAIRGVSRATLATAVELAKDLVADNEIGRDLVGYANHYHTLDVKPTWSRGKQPVAVVGRHKFFKL